MDKLYVIVRADLPPGLFVAQAVHAMSTFAIYHPAEHRAWYLGSNTIVILAVENEAELQARQAQAQAFGEHTAGFHDSDLGDSLTAIATTARKKKLVRDLPSAFKAA